MPTWVRFSLAVLLFWGSWRVHNSEEEGPAQSSDIMAMAAVVIAVLA